MTSETDAHQIAAEGYIYFYPLITMDVTPRLSTNVEPGKKAGFGPAGMFLTMRVCAPRAQALDGRWNPPAVKRVK